MAKSKKKLFTVTVIDNRTVAIDVKAESAEEASDIISFGTFADILKEHPHRVVHSEFSVDEITEN